MRVNGLGAFHSWYVLIIQYHAASCLIDHRYYPSYHHNWDQRWGKKRVRWRANRFRGRLNFSFLECAGLAVVINPLFWHQKKRGETQSDGQSRATTAVNPHIPQAWLKKSEPQCNITHGLHLHSHSLTPTEILLHLLWGGKRRGHYKMLFFLPLNPLNFICLPGKKEELQHSHSATNLECIVRMLQSMTGGFY